MSIPIVERISLSELKEFIVMQNLVNLYTADNDEIFKRYVTIEGLDAQPKNTDCMAKLWIQYFPIANQFSLNVNFFATIDGKSITPEDFIDKVPTATKLINYVNKLKIQWIQDESGVYRKYIPDMPIINLPPGVDNIYLLN